jgi:SAM-dependent methyltransferase
MNKNFSNLIKYILDNFIPPILRDSEVFMHILMFLAFGRKKKYFMEFKAKVPFLSKEEYQEYYNILKDDHFQTETDLNSKSLSVILENIVGETVLDVGCGKGFLARQIYAKYKIDVTGIDIIFPQYDDEIKYLKGEAENIPFEDKKFDTVICSHTLEHIPNILKAINEIRRVAKKRIILVVPREREYKYTFNLHVHFFPYSHSFHKLLNNKNAKCLISGTDIVYIEDCT